MARHFAVGAETTYGTAVTPTEFVEALSETLQAEPSFEHIKTIRSPSVRKVVQLADIVRGDVVAVGNYQDMGLLLKHLLGSVDSVTSSTTTAHTFPASTGIPATDRDGFSLTGEMLRDGNILWTYAGLKVTGFQLQAAVDSVAQVTWSFLGKSSTATTGSGTAQSFPTLDVMIPSEITVNVQGSAQDAKSCSISVQWPVDEPYKLGSTTLAVEPKSSDTIEVTGEVVVLFQDMTEYDLFAAYTDTDLQISITNATESLVINCDKTRITQATPHVDGRNRLEATYQFSGYFNATATPGVQFVLTNDDAAIP